MVRRESSAATGERPLRCYVSPATTSFMCPTHAPSLQPRLVNLLCVPQAIHRRRDFRPIWLPPRWPPLAPCPLPHGNRHPRVCPATDAAEAAALVPHRISAATCCRVMAVPDGQPPPGYVLILGVSSGRLFAR